MRCRLRDPTREVQICDPFSGPPEGELTPLPRDKAVALVRWLAGDPDNAEVLRDLQAARRRSTTAPPTAFDMFVAAPSPTAHTLEEIERGALVVFVGTERVADSDLPDGIEPLVEEDAEPLVAEEQEPPPADVVAQVAALRAAAETGAPFCEE